MSEEDCHKHELEAKGIHSYTVTTFKYVEGGTGPMAAEVVEDTCLVSSVYLRAWGGPRTTCPEVVEEI